MDPCTSLDHDAQACEHCSPLNTALRALESGELPELVDRRVVDFRAVWLCLESALLGEDAALLAKTPPVLEALLAQGDTAGRPLAGLLGSVARRARDSAEVEPLRRLWHLLLEAGADPSVPCRFREELRVAERRVVWATQEVVHILFPPRSGRGSPAARALLADLLARPGYAPPPGTEAYLRDEAGDPEAADQLR